MIPKLYQKDGTTLIGDLTNCIECLVEEERNGIFEVTFQYPNEEIASSLVYDNIIICDANDTLKNQKFRIYDTRRMMNDTIDVYARHISFDLAYDYINSIDITNQSCEYALNTIFRSSQFSTGYVGHSDIVNAQNYKISNCNALEAIAGKQGSIIDTYGTGAEILRDNTDIHVLNRRGNDNGVSIEYAKNLTGFELQENTDDLITRIIPFATYTPEGGEQTRVQGSAVNSSYISNYSHPFIAEIDFSDKFKDKETPTLAKLNTMAQRYFEENKCDLPKQNWKIEFIPLSKCVGYESIEDAISLCDTVTIRDTRYDVDTKAKVIKTVYDVLRERYDSMELGEPRTTLGDIVNTGSEKGEQGPPGPQGPKGEDGNIGDFPDSVPAKPVLTATLLGFASIQLDWTYENKPYYWYEVYASKTKDFTPNVFDIIHKGQTSSFLYQAKPGETWYFRVCGVNSYDHRSEFSDQLEVVTTLVDNLENYFTTAAIGHAVVGSLTADYMEVGILKGQWIDARNLSVTDGNGLRTLDIDSNGDVSLNVNSLAIQSKNVATQEYTTDTATSIATSIANTAASNAVNNQTQTSIFNKLTNNGQTQGIYLQDGKIYLNGEYMQIDSIDGRCIKLGDFNNYVTLPMNAYFTGSSGNTWGYEICNISGSEVYNNANLTNRLYGVNGGDDFRVKAMIKCDTANSRLDITCCWKNANHEIVTSKTIYTVVSTANTWTEINEKIMVPSRPSGGSYVQFKINVQAEQSRRFYVERLSITRMYGAELIVDGAITTDKLSADCIDGRIIKGVTIVGGELRGSSNFYTAPDENATEGYGFRIYADGSLYSNNTMQIEGTNNNYCIMKPDGTMTASAGFSSPTIQASTKLISPLLNTTQTTLCLGVNGAELNYSSNNLLLQDGLVRPGNNSTMNLGKDNARWKEIFSTSGVNTSSDRTLKENIQYLNTSNNSKACQCDITEEDLYNFVRDDLIVAKYNFIGSDKDVIGFIAQDVIYNLDGTDNIIGQILVNKTDEEQAPLSYNEKTYSGILAGALRKAINKIEEQQRQIDELSTLVNRLINKEGE